MKLPPCSHRGSDVRAGNPILDAVHMQATLGDTSEARRPWR
jgi:hypothetical protein